MGAVPVSAVLDSAVLASAVLALEAQAVSQLAHHQLLMLLTSADPDLAALVVSLEDSRVDSHKVPHQLLMPPTSAVPVSAVLASAVLASAVLALEAQAVSLLAHHQLLMLPTSVVPDLAALVVSLVDSPVDSQLAHLQLLMLLTLAVPASVVQDLAVLALAAQAVSAPVQLPKLSAPQDRVHQLQMPQQLKLPQLISPTSPRNPDDDDRQESKSVLFGHHAEPVFAF